MDEHVPGARAEYRGAARFALVAVLLLLVLSAVIVPTYLNVPNRNTSSDDVDCLLVLGSPTEIDGSLSPEQRWRVTEAVRLYQAGRAQHILMSGGPTSKGYVEARTMAEYARQLGVPSAAILEEGASMNTRENIQNSEQMLQARGWQRVEVISSAEHLPRAALLLQHSHLLWQTHAAPTPGRSRFQIAGAYAEEAFATMVIRSLGLHALPVLHAFAVVQGSIGYACRWVLYAVQSAWKRT
ncbi:MAG: YdcF family protein [Janthinobacterium lividum]